VWELVSRLLKDFDLLQAGLELFIEEELRSVLVDPNKETESWAKKLVEVDRKRSAFQDQQAEGLITLDELRSKLAPWRRRVRGPHGIGGPEGTTGAHRTAR
jgi:hypothetical protein